MWKLQAITVLASFTFKTRAQPPSFGEVNNAGVARWMAEEAPWGTLTTSTNPFNTNQEKDLFAGVSPFATSSEDGRIFFFLMNDTHLHGSALTVSQAAMTPGLFPVAGCGSMDSAVDAQDPRCAKITYQGSIHPCSAEHSVGANCDEIGRKVLFDKYPVMAEFPADHNFRVHEFAVDSIWMIANFGGGGNVTPEEYHQASPEEHNIVGGTSINTIDVANKEVPSWDDYAGRARWIVQHSLFTSVSTRTDDEKTFGNIRSITDGGSLSTSTGMPTFFLPDVDPTAVDIKNENKIILTFSEAALAQLVSDDGKACSGQMAGIPTCAQLSLYGKAVPTEDDKVLEHFRSYHPLAPWLAQGGSHMEGKYYTVEIEKIVILDYFGGPHEVTVQDYLDYQFPADNEATTTTPNHDEYVLNNNGGMGGMGDHSHGNGEHGGMSSHEHGNYNHGEGDQYHGHQEEGSENSGIIGHDHGNYGIYSSSSSESSENTASSEEAYHMPYFFIIVAAFFGSFLGTCARDKCARRKNRYIPAQKSDLSSLQFTVDTAEAC